ncbi:hypothetical protein M1M27_gp24 [Cellulophaga phage Ingeline_1]|uniref:Uncharacterized protein n=1 Tax=Cellulophaga phage Ingeline_1 TaxID=2745674 RepID=A0A8E4ZBC2_9CAUD|nr:hypothetical protein M1M27_gp24 [Cellulophaga phage Ingeline_1]QQV90014.1 hypothetical protein Ingeline2_27 [Cellulophaga phage Ingeline_2]QQV90064.1 hypothetical protein Ingeline3_27 [Cellulophaga phage Ingeline_3]QQV90114.1 hypothetical protein Ingeline4_27 [Cellulophaga phage Ingeline_4]QQV90164.1 hypothetical protein Ingeline5_27 [Cellulophaga phage Ingeline_5]QQV90213.1 hypothetical protein Ingeline6_27 [Cellulophaga phage Ingeline_6]QQV90263.1 hypothetical protein Ingeline7_27 [Cellu
MTAKEFCEHYGITLNYTEVSALHYRIDVIDANKIIFSSGEKKGVRIFKTNFLTIITDKTYQALMNLILDLKFS